ncbi:MAG: hypothetical protein U0Q15_12620 [Kineosporiaceae bacterium]
MTHEYPTWSWRFEAPDGTPVTPEGFSGSDFPSQADAESWVGENWRELLAAGVEQVVLLEGDREVYGPMSLRPVR